MRRAKILAVAVASAVVLGSILIGLLVVPANVSAAITSGVVARLLPTKTADGSTARTRFGRYGESYSIPITQGTYAIADEGQYFHAATATPATAFTLTGATQTGFNATTSATFTVKNNDSALGKRLYLDYVRIIFATAGTAGTRIEGAVVIDNTTRYSSGGTALSVYNNNMDETSASISTQAFAGAVTATAASGSVRYACRFQLKTAIATVGDALMVNFGAINQNQVSNQFTIVGCPPVVLGPGHSVVVYTWQPSQSAAPTGEVEAGWWER